jgi:hypothetical protein
MNETPMAVLATRFARTVLAAVLVLFAPAALCAPPQTLHHQGYLTTSAGAPVDGTVTVDFSLYDAPSGGNLLWTETQSVTVQNGHYAVILGNVIPFGLSFDAPYWLGVKAGADAEMSPRAALTMVPYAFRALAAEGAVNAAALGGQPPSSFALAGHLHSFGDLSDTLQNAQLSGTYNLNPVVLSNGTFFGAFTGSGAGLSALNASSLASGTVPPERLAAGGITDSHVSATAAIASSKLALRGGVFLGRINNLGSAPQEFGAATGMTSATSTESDVQTLSPNAACSAANLSVQLTTAPGAGNSREFVLNGATLTQTSVRCTITNSATTCTSASTDTVAAGSPVSIQVINGGTPAAASALFGWECR